jgi:hypothetical protein
MPEVLAFINQINIEVVDINPIIPIASKLLKAG